MRAKILIAAVDKTGGIGTKGTLPWHISEDLRMFKRQTLNQIVVMGMSTFSGMFTKYGTILPERQTVVITRSPQDAVVKYAQTILNNPKDSLLFTNDLKLENILGLKEDCNIFYCGGAKIYQQIIDHIDLMLLSRIPQGFYECDTFFPTAATSTEGNWRPYLPKDFKLISAEPIPEYLPLFTLETYVAITRNSVS